ncbi:unnamed protein product [Oikopleura dioica]|uniref:GRAM domain-containing protein n=1 Tax=Oikopleura dioica TaxID=34765 RepID=E4WY36_OIKDI|nr:unnamed protein product [Oikopleura dioica]
MTVLRRNMRNNQSNEGSSSLYSASNADDDCSEDEGFGEQPNKLINRFIEKVSDSLCIACNILNSRSSTLGQHVSFEIQRLAEDYDLLSRATARIPKFNRPVDQSPKYLENEKVEAQISVHLLPDRREFGIYGITDSGFGLRHSDGEVFLPAEGTLYLTNYRVLFYGYSKELEHLSVIRSAPITSVIKVKQSTTPSAPRYLSNHRLEIRTATVEFFHAAFTSEVTEDQRRRFHDTLMQLRFPEDNSPLSVFAFAKNPKD